MSSIAKEIINGNIAVGDIISWFGNYMSKEVIRFFMNRANGRENPTRVDMSICTIPDPDLKVLLDEAEHIFLEYQSPFIISEQIRILQQLGLGADDFIMRNLIHPRKDFPGGIIKHKIWEVLGKERPVFNFGQMQAAIVFLSTKEMEQSSLVRRIIPDTVVLTKAVERLGGPNHPIADCFNPRETKRIVDKEVVLKDIGAIKNPDLGQDLYLKATELAILENSQTWPLSRPELTALTITAFKGTVFAEQSKGFESFITNLLSYPFIPSIYEAGNRILYTYMPEHVLAIWAYLYEYEQIGKLGAKRASRVQQSFNQAIRDLGEDHKYARLLKGEQSEVEQDDFEDRIIIYDADEGRSVLEGVGIEQLTGLVATIQQLRPLDRVQMQNLDIPIVAYQAILEIRRIYLGTKKGTETPRLQNKEYLGWINSCIRLIRNPNVNGCSNLLQALEYMKAREQKTLQKA